MDVKTQLLALYELQQLDSAIDALKKSYAGLDRGQAEQPQYEAAKAAHQEAQAALKVAEANLRDTELEQKSVEAKRADEETRLYSGRVRVPKELQALQEEVEMLTRQRSRLDERLLGLMGDLEACRRREAETKQALAAITKTLRAKLEAFNAEAEKMKAQAQLLARQRAEAAKDVPPDLLKRYEALRAVKGGIAVVAILDGNACGGCHMGLPFNTVRRVHAGGEIMTCENCGRILCEKA
jgi:predicted  nucleic acid-binding Zn-ribbon protein